MSAAASPDKPEVSDAHRKLLFAAACVTLLLVTMGGVVCVIGAARACPDWPGCYGRAIPPLRTDALVEYLHRLLALCTACLIASAAVLGWMKYRRLRWISVPPVIAIMLVFVVAAFGAMAVLYGLSPALAAIDLGFALLVLALTVAAWVVAHFARGRAQLRASPSFSDSFATVALCCFGAVFIVLVTGPLGEVNGPLLKCLAWPLYSERPAASGLSAVRYFIADTAGLCVAILVIQAWRTKRSAPALIKATHVVALLLVVLFALGPFVRPASVSLVPLLYITVTAAFWAALAVLVVLAGMASRRAGELTAPEAIEGGAL